MKGHPMRYAILALLLTALTAAPAMDDPMVLTASQSTTLRPDILGDPGYVPNEIDMMIYGPKNPNPNFRGMVQFDLKDVPKNPPVTAAVLRLTFYKLSGVRNKVKLDIIRVHRLLRPWDEKKASWAMSMTEDEWINKGGDFDPAPAASTILTEDQTGDPSNKPVEFDVTSLVQAWQSGQSPNFGMILITSDNDSNTNSRPYSRKATDDAFRPKLELHWATQPKHNSAWLKPTTLKPLGTMPQMKVALIASLKQGRVGEAFEDHIKAKGGCAPYTFKVTGALPEGLVLSPDGKISGTPTKEGKFPLAITISDAAKNSGSGKTDIDVVIPDKGAAAAPKKDGEKKDDAKPEEKKPVKPKVEDE
jgi:hypothetical protein